MSNDLLSGKWNELGGRLQELWGDLTDSDLEKTKGSFKEAVGHLQAKYGETKEAVEHKLASLLDE